jgi:hypothetical protein
MLFVREYMKIYEYLNTAYKSWNAMLTRNGKFQKQQEMEKKLSDVCKAHEKELADMNAVNTVLKAKLQNALARVVCSRRELEEAALVSELHLFCSKMFVKIMK